MVSDHNTQQRPAERIIAVVVTYNRRALLERTLSGIATGQLTPDLVIIVNNASTDSTRDYLDSLEYDLEADIVHLPKNVGGAGGFTVGIDRALVRHQADLVWVMDDDTEPTQNTLSEAYRAWADYAPVRSERPVLVASKVVWVNGQDHPMNTMRTMFAAGAERTAKAVAVGARPIRSASFVSILMDGAAMRATELPLADFFIWNDDFEYTTRLIHHGQAIATPRSLAIHHTRTFGTTDSAPGPRFYNDVRNKLWVFCRRRTLAPHEKLLYGLATGRLWVRTLLSTAEKKTYTSYFLKGLRDATSGYRPNSEVLAGVYELETEHLAQHVRAGYSKATDFSLLMSIYQADKPQYLQAALASNTIEQTRRPTQVVLVQDGPISEDLTHVVRDFMESAPMPVKLIQLQNNHGLAAALREGLAACSYDLVARADADDISLPERFERQVPLVATGQFDVLGSAMYEFTDDATTAHVVRHVARGSRRISELISQRNPMLHPTVVFRKSAVEAVGSYTEVPGAEDYWLWARMDKAGFILGNLSEPLVRYRVSSAYSRRGGIAALRKDIHVQCRLYSGNIIGPTRLIKNMGIRGIYRLAPEKIRTKAFRTMTGRTLQELERKGDIV